MHEYRVKVSVRNNLILTKIEAAGYVGWGSIGRFLQDIGMGHGEFQALAAMRACPINQNGEFSSTAKKLMDFLCCSPTDLWTERQLTTRLDRNTGEAAVDWDGVQYILENHINQMTLPSPEHEAQTTELIGIVNEVISNLTKRERAVIQMRFGIGDTGEMTLKEVADSFGVTKERIRQIEAKALRKIREKKLASAFGAYAEGGISDL